jgi:PAS domain S-box-containing protein
MIMNAVRDATGDIVDFAYDYANPTATTAVRIPADRLWGMRLLEIAPGVRGDLLERYIRVVETAETAELELFYDADGFHGWWRSVVVKVGDGLAFHFQDITERKRIETALQESEERLRRALAAARMVAWRWDLRTDKTTMSDTAKEILGVEPISIGAHAEGCMLLHPEDEARHRETIRDALAQRSSYHEQLRILRPDTREVIWLENHASPECDEHNTPIAMSGIIRDITEQKRAEEALKEANRRKDEFIAMLAHELRNPLSPISTSVELLRRLSPPNPRTERAHAVIDRQVKHMVRLIDDLLDVSRISRGKILVSRELLDFTGLVRVTVEDHLATFTARRIDLRTRLSATPIWVHGDMTRLAQVIGNLLHNAAKFTNEGGAVTVQLEAGTEHAILEVADTGIGMDPELLPRIFEPFSQADRSLDRSRGGLGLGLSLVKGLIELHGGSVQAASEGVDRGSRFRVTIPVAGPAARADGRWDTVGRSPASRRVLIIEDNADAADSLRDLLELLGHAPTVAHTGPAGVAAAREVLPQLILCDIGLPGGMDGYAVARALRATPGLEAVPLVALTGYGQEEERRRAHEAGFDLHMTKPASLAILERLLAELSVRPA